MSKPANKTVIGMFVIGAIALAVAAVLILGSEKFFRQTFRAVCYFEGDVGGLNIGAPVVFKGVKIGSVTEVVLRYDTQKLSYSIQVYTEIEPHKIQVEGPIPKTFGQHLNALIDQGLRAQLEMQSIVTGQMQVGLDFHPDKPARLVGADSKYPEIPTIPTPMQELAKKIQNIPIDEIFAKLSSALSGIDKLVKSPEIPEAIRSVNLALGDVRKLVKDVDGQIDPLASNLNETVKDIRRLVQNTDTKVTGLASSLDDMVKEVRGLVQIANAKVTGLTASLDETVKDVRGVVRNVDSRIGPLTASIEGTLKSLDATMIAAKKAMENIEGTAGKDSATVYQINRTFEEINSLARSIRVLSDYLQRHPESVIRGK